ncbi:glycosyltransferase family A protein [Formosa sp. PL04]|uniref:glycosyltransferase family 2 protein n=1 Tax=Formosa sp. PL04 TaxID=3081755 RepID=UPI0029827239|nr:glycosyltransferase family A protein [Formosa sp. PL04]MDW5288838.1 glycosyltransferase family A protein [Formosa sp. PL04]
MIKISVIISVYNKEAHIENTLQSVFNQSYKNFEIIAINDGSTDKSLDILHQIKDTRLRVFSQQNLGASAARNRGIKEASTQYIALLDGDDIWLPNYLKDMVTLIKNHPQEHVFACAIANTYNNRIIPVTYNFKDNDLIKVRDYFKNSTHSYTLLTSSSIIFKKDIIDTTGWYDTSIKSGQDTDMWIRIGMHYNVVFLNSVLVHYKYINDSLSNTSFNPNTKPKYDKYKIEESKNSDLKAFVDRNRYSLAILSRLNGNRTAYTFYKTAIDLKNIRTHQRILLYCPSWLLKTLLKLKSLKGKKVYYIPLNKV